jgi:hypothetical protein
LVKDGSAWAFSQACKQTANHDGLGTCDKCFRDVTDKTNPSVRDGWYTCLLARFCGLINCGDLRNTDTGNDTGCTDGTWTNSNLDRIRSRFGRIATTL